MIKRTVDRFLRSVVMLSFGVLGMMLLAALVALRHIMETPQPLESYIPGEAHIYRWKHGNIFYKEMPGPQEATPLVLLHAPDIGASSYEMRHLMGQPGLLAEQFRIFAPDLPGFGLSDRPQMDYCAETYIALVQDFLRDVVGRPAVLVASGLSNNYAVAVAQRSPDLCQRLVLISPSTLFHHESGQSFLPALIQAPFTGTLLYPVVSTHLALRYRAQRQHSVPAGNIPASDIDYLYAASHQFGAEHAPLALMAGKLDIDVSSQFANLQQPTLMIWGTQALNNLRALSEQHEVPAHGHVELIKNAGAAVHEEYPASVIRNILAWSATDRVVGEPESGAGAQAEPSIEVEIVAAEAPMQVQEQQAVKVVEAYCVKCKKKTAMLHIEEVTTKNGSPAMRGKCSVCGTGQYRMGRLA